MAEIWYERLRADIQNGLSTFPYKFELYDAQPWRERGIRLYLQNADLARQSGNGKTARAAGTPIISAMGAGNKLEASLFEVADIYETSVCPLARVMRRELRKRGVERLKVVYSKEKPTRPIEDMSISCRSHCICPPGAERTCLQRRDIPGSMAFVPSGVGLIIAGEVVKDLTAAERDSLTAEGETAP